MALYCYFTFPTTFYAIRAEELLKNRDIPFKMVPVPRSISSSCGTALRCLPEDTEEINEIFESNALELEEIHRIEEKELTFRTFLRGGKEKR